MSRVTVEVVVPTSRPDGLRRLLDGLARQEGVEDWSVLVVDNHPDGVAGRPVSAPPGLPVAIRSVHEPRAGASHARNRGLAETDRDVVVFLDDDVAITDRSWLRRLVAPVKDGAVAAGGPVRLDPDVTVPDWIDAELRGFLTQHDLGLTRRRLSVGEYLLTANLAVQREAVLAAGGFDPSLGPRPGVHLTNDDLDLSRRLLATGRPVVWVPDAPVTHEVPASRLAVKWLLRRFFAQGRSDYLLHRSMLRTGRFHGIFGRSWSALASIADRARRGAGRGLAFRIAAEVFWLWGYLREALPDLLRSRVSR